MPVIIDERIGKVLDKLKENAEKRRNMRKEFVDYLRQPLLREDEQKKNEIIKKWEDLYEDENRLWQEYDKFVSQQKDC